MTPTYFKSVQTVDYLLKKFRDPAFDDHTRAHISNYICVLLSGLLETAIREIIAIYCEKKSIPAIANFVKNRLERFQNPDPESILQLLNSFDSGIGDKLEQQWSGEIKDAVGSIVGNRHLIAHGRDTSTTLTRVSEWTKAAKKFIEFMEKEFA
jgi:uncharacterized protein YjbJ (UPF0337 family)